MTGCVDLFIAKGNVAEMPDFAVKDPNNLLLQGADGKFIEAGGQGGRRQHRRLARRRAGGFQSRRPAGPVVVNRWESAQIWRNTTADAGQLARAAAERSTAPTAMPSAPGSR